VSAFTLERRLQSAWRSLHRCCRHCPGFRPESKGSRPSCAPGDGQAAEWAAGAVANVLRVGEDARSVAVNAGAATSLAALLPKVSASGRPLVVVALTTLAESKASTVEAALGAKEKALLREFRDSGDEDLQGYTKGLVYAIGNGFAL